MKTKEILRKLNSSRDDDIYHIVEDAAEDNNLELIYFILGFIALNWTEKKLHIALLSVGKGAIIAGNEHLVKLVTDNDNLTPQTRELVLIELEQFRNDLVEY